MEKSIANKSNRKALYWLAWACSKCSLLVCTHASSECITVLCPVSWATSWLYGKESPYIIKCHLFVYLPYCTDDSTANKGVSIVTWLIPNAPCINIQCAPCMKSKELLHGRIPGPRMAVSVPRYPGLDPTLHSGNSTSQYPTPCHCASHLGWQTSEGIGSLEASSPGHLNSDQGLSTLPT